MLFIALRKAVSALQKKYFALSDRAHTSDITCIKRFDKRSSDLLSPLKLLEYKYFSGELKKIGFAMRLTAFCLLVFCLQINASVKSQSVNISERNVPLSTIFSVLEKQTGYLVAGNVNLLKNADRVSIEARNEPLQQFLSRLLNDKGIGFAIRRKTIVLSRRAVIPPLKEVKTLPEQMVVKIVFETITGRVVDSTGAPLSGASIKVKGSSGGTKTNSDGYFSINVQMGQTLQISYVGYITAEVTIRDLSPLAITLLVEDASLEQLIVIGYGTQKERDLTGAVSTVKGDVVSQRNEIQLSTALQGLAPGVTVTRSNSMPGSGATIRVRGITTIGNSNPLILVDGVPVESINMVNPNDVENISVLKDAASASIYGARASAGVILITTKRAKTNQLNLEYQGNFGTIEPTQFPGTVGYKRYLEMINEIAWNDGGNQVGAEYGVYDKDFIENYAENHRLDPDAYPLTDWIDLLINKSAPYTRHGLSLTYGNEVIKSKASVNYENAQALYNNRSYERITSRLNSDIKINKFLSAEVGASFIHALTENTIVNPLSAAYKYGPIWTPFWSDGRISNGRNGTNSWARMNYGGFNNNWDDQFFGKIALNFKPVKNLTITGAVAPTVQIDKSKQFIKQLAYYNLEDKSTTAGFLDGNLTTSLNEGRSEVRTMIKQLIANYNLKLGGQHDLGLMAGYEDYYRFAEGLSAASDNFLLADFPYLDRAPLDFMRNTGNANESAYNSYFGRLTYDFANKYLFQANLRRDGSSRFDKDYRWAVFPSVSLGWVITEENFFKNLNSGVLDFLKFRGSFGTLGNERIGNYPYQAILNFSNALFVEGSNVVSRTTAAQQSYNIRDITWETTESWNIGVDARFFNSRLSLTADYYKKRTRDMLLDLEIPDFMGYGNPSQNAGIMHTKGWDAQIGWNDYIGELKYSISANISDYKSVMGNLSGTVFDGAQIIREGSEFNEWYGYRSDGLYQSQEEVDNSATLSSVVKPGDVRYLDISGPDGVPDGKISPEYDRVLLGGSQPRYLYGGNINLGYKGFDLGIVFQGIGRQNSRVLVDMVYQTSAWFTFPDFVDGNYYSEYNTAEQNANAKYPRLSQIGYQGNNYEMSDYWLFNGGYFRLKNITLGYTLPAKWMDAVKVSNMRLYASASDLFSIDKYPKGWDPEAGLTAYIARTWNFGVQIRF